MSLILTFPDEILLHIAVRLCTTDLKALTLANRRFRIVSHECLFQNGAIRPVRIFDVIDEVHRTLGLANRVSHLRLGTVDGEAVKEMNYMRPAYRNMPPDGFQTCSDIINAATTNEISLAWLFALREEPDFYLVGVSLLIAQLKALNTMSADTSILYNVRLLKSMFYRHTTIATRTPRWILRVQSLLQQRLTTLIITCNDSQGGWGKAPTTRSDDITVPSNPVETRKEVYKFATPGVNDRLDLSKFTSLNHLEVPGHFVRDMERFFWEILPLPLQTLVIHFGIKYVWFDFDWTHQLITSWNPPKELRTIELRFDLNLYSQIHRIQDLYSNRILLDPFVKILEQNRIDFKTCFGHVKLAQLGDGPRIGEVTTWKTANIVEAIDYFFSHKIAFGTNDEQVLKYWGFNVW